MKSQKCFFYSFSCAAREYVLLLLILILSDFTILGNVGVPSCCF